MNMMTSFIGGAWDFASLHPFVSAWLAATSAWTLFTIARREA